MAYMEMFGNCSHSNNDFISGLGTRHSVAAYNSMQAEWQQHEMALTTTQSCSFMAHTITTLHDNSKYAFLDIQIYTYLPVFNIKNTRKRVISFSVPP